MPTMSIAHTLYSFYNCLKISANIKLDPAFFHNNNVTKLKKKNFKILTISVN